MQASMPLVDWYSTFSSQVSELVCLMAETFRAKGLAIAKDSSKCKKKRYVNLSLITQITVKRHSFLT